MHELAWRHNNILSQVMCLSTSQNRFLSLLAGKVLSLEESNLLFDSVKLFEMPLDVI